MSRANNKTLFFVLVFVIASTFIFLNENDKLLKLRDSVEMFKSELERLKQQETENSLEIERLKQHETENSLKIKRFTQQETENSEIKKLKQQETENSLEIERLTQLETENSLKIERLAEQDTENSLEREIERLKQQETENSLKIERLTQLETENSLRIDRLTQQETENSLKIEIEQLKQQEAENSLEIEPSSPFFSSSLHDVKTQSNITATSEIVLTTYFDIHFVLIYDHVKPKSFCGVESVIRVLSSCEKTSNATRVNLWTSDPSMLEREHAALLLEFRNLASATKCRLTHLVIRPLKLPEIFQDTPLFDFYSLTPKDQLGFFASQNEANAVRLAIIYKYGGAYFDTDMIFVADPLQLPYGFGLQTRASANNAAFSFPKSFPFIFTLMNDFVKFYNGSKWGNQGPLLITRNIASLCTQYKKPKFSPDCKELGKFKLWSPDNTSLIKVPRLIQFFSENQAEFLRQKPKIVTIHLWNKMLRTKERIMIHKPDYDKTFIGFLRATYCPRTKELIQKML